MPSHTASASASYASDESDQRNVLLGIAGALVVTCVWSGWVVVSRLGVTQTLTPYDVVALRFATIGLLMAPFAYSWWPRHLKWWQVLILASGPGAPYAVVALSGMQFAPTAHAGTLMNGTLPIFASIIAFFWIKEKPTAWKVAGMAVILGGCAAIGLDGAGLDIPGIWRGHLLFLAAALLLATYMIASRKWGLTTKQLLVVVGVTSAVLYLPVWYLAGLPSNVMEAPMSEILLQSLYQGLGPSLIGVICFYLAIIHLGPVPTAAFMSAVPVLAGLLAIPVLDEWPTTLAWTGMALVTTGILLTLGRGRKIFRA